jgi:hypothetical protein
MKKLIAALITLSMLFSISTNIYSDESDTSKNHIRIYDPENYIADYMTFYDCGVNGYYNCYIFEGRDIFYFNPESGDTYALTEVGDLIVYKIKDVYYMSSSRIEAGYYNGKYYHGEGPVADILTGFPQYEYKVEDIDSLQKYLVNPSDKSVLLRPIFLKKGTDSSKQVNYTHDPGYYDYNMNNVYDVTDLAMMKYDVLHNVTKNRNEKIEIQKNSD